MKIALLDDDRTALQLFEQALSGGEDAWAKTLKISLFTSGQQLLNRLREETFDALVLDRYVPDVGGDEILTWVRTYLPASVVVIMVTGKAGVSESSILLSQGADDYLTKPFNGVDLLARLKRLLERVADGRATINKVKSDLGRFSLLGFEFNRADLSVKWQDEMVRCSNREFALAVFLCRNMGRALSREEVYESVYLRRAVTSSRALDTLVYRTRAKLKLDERRGFVVQPIYGYGYRLDVFEGMGL